MENCLKILSCNYKNSNIPEEFNFFGKLIGSWSIDYIDNSSSGSIKGEWHFSWILDGMAIQDVILLPGFEFGTTIRIYNSVTHNWYVSYSFAGKIIRLEARKENDLIVLTDIDNNKRKWVFVDIEDNNFHWQDIYVKDDGSWQVKYDLYAERIYC